jgi:undecaprenyl-diphosphatase
MSPPRSQPSSTSSSGPVRAAAAAIASLALRLGSMGLGRTRALYAALGLYLSIALAAAVVAVLGFAEIAEDVLEGDTERFDQGLLEWLRSNRSDWMDRIALELTTLGSGVVLCASGILVSVLLWHLGRKRHVALVWLAAAGAFVLSFAMKLAFGRPRPEIEGIVQLGTPSFPSGHALNAMVFYTVIAFVVGRVVGSGWGRTVVYAFGVFVVAVVGWTRIYLGVHYPSDVGAGYAVGYAWAVLCVVAMEAWARPRTA